MDKNEYRITIDLFNLHENTGRREMDSREFPFCPKLNNTFIRYKFTSVVSVYNESHNFHFYDTTSNWGKRFHNSCP